MDHADGTLSHSTSRPQLENETATGGPRLGRVRGPTVILVRLGARGDVVFASPLVGALRRRHPGARIIWVVESSSVDLIRHHPEVDRVVIWPREEWSRALRRGRLLHLWGAVRRFSRSFSVESPALAVDLHGLLRSAFVARLTGAREVVGLGSKEGSRVLVHRVVPRDAGDVSRVSSEYLHLARTLGWEDSDFRMQVHLGESDRERAAALLRKEGIAGHYAVLAPFTTRPQKHWREERWGPLTRRIREETGMPAVILGGPNDRESASRISRTGDAGSPPVVLAGETTLGEAASVVGGAALLVGVDTGLTHLAGALGVPAVALFGSTLPYTHVPGARVRVLHLALTCSPCRTRPVCRGAYSCMAGLEVEQVVAAAKSVLAEQASPVPGPGHGLP